MRWAALAVAAVGLLALGVSGYLMPPDASSGWWVCPSAGEHWRRVVPFADRLPVLGVNEWRWFFRVALVLAWGGYGWLVWSHKERPGLPRLSGWASVNPAAPYIASAVPLLVAVFAPPALSSDVYSYAMDGRMAVVYGTNPYSVSEANPQPRTDEATTFAAHDYPPPYGPVWVSLAVVVAAVVPGLFGQVVALKLVQAVALIGASRVARELGGEVARFAVLLNPLLVIEGAGSGHNDVLMVALLLAAVWAWKSDRWTLAGVLVGLAAGVKVLPVAVLPWLAVLAYRGDGWKRAVRVVGVAVAVLAVAYLPYLNGGRFFDGMAATAGQSATADQKTAATIRSALLAGVGWLAGAVWVMRNRYPTAWAEAWAAFALVMAFAVNARCYPWYLTWVLVPVLCGAVRRAGPVGIAACALGAGLQWLYTHDW